MANMYNINSLSWTVHENPEWFTRAAFGGRLVSGGYIRVLTGIKGDELLSQIDLQSKVLQADGKDCAWTPSQIIKLSEKTARVKTYKINLEQCIDELENKRTLYQLSAGAQNEELPDALEEATLFLISVALSNEIEEMIIGGNSTIDPNAFDGMERILTVSTESTQIAGEVLTKADVLDEIEEVYNAIPENVLQGEDAGTLYILCSYNARRLIRAALADKNNMVIAASWTVDDTDKRNPKLFYLGVELVPVKGIGKDTLIAYDATNAYLLTDMLSDLEDIQLGQFPAPNDSKIYIKGRMRLGFVIPFEDECVIASTAITADRMAPAPMNVTVIPNSLVFKAEGETLTANIVTLAADTPTVQSVAAGFTVTAGTPTASGGFKTTPLSIVATSNEGAQLPRTGDVLIKVTGSDNAVTLSLNQRYDVITTIVP